MSNLEHYFENLLFDGKDCRGDVNKNALTKEEQEAVEICAQYVIWSIFTGRDEFKNFIRQEFEPVKHGRWINKITLNNGLFDTEHGECSECGWNDHTSNYCPNCGADMREESDIDENWYSDEYREIGEDERDEVEE